MAYGEHRLGNRAVISLGTILALGLVSAPARAQERDAPRGEQKGRPRITVEPKALDVGEVFVGETGKGEIKIMNTGTAPLKISKVRSSCGCTAAKLKNKDKEIPPGGSVTLPVTIKPSRTRKGERFVKSITILSNDPIQPVLAVQIEAQVKLGVDSIPYSLVFRKMQYGEVRPQELKLISRTEEAFRITQIGEVAGPVLIEYDKERLAHEHTVRVTVGPMPDSNNMHQRLRITTTHSKTPHLTVPLLVEVEKLVTVSPTYLNLGRHDPGTIARTRITFTTKGEQTVEAVEARVTRYPIKVTAEPVEGSPNQWELAFEVPEDLRVPKVISYVVITTNIKEAGPIKVNMSLRVNRPAAEASRQKPPAPNKTGG